MNDPSGAIRNLEAIWSALAGAAFGSFANVVVARVPAGESIIRPRSRCPRCQHPIAWYDNLPIASWFVLRGRCRACGGRISPRYPAVEAVGAVAAVVAFSRHGFNASAAAEFAFVMTLLALALIDLDTWLLPHALTRPLLAAGVAAAALGIGPAPSLRSSVLGAALGFGVLWVVALVGRSLLKKEAMGGGDLWLLGALGAWTGAPALLPTLLLASVQGSIIGVALIALGKGQSGPPSPEPSPAGDAAGQGEGEGEEIWIPPRHAIPFGPFLVFGALEWLYLGDWIARLVPALEVFR